MNAHPPIIGLTLNYRDATRTLRCINSLLKEGAVHVLVLDNSEDDGASATALSQSLNVNAKVSIEVSLTNLGFAAGVNRGIEWITVRFGQAWVLLLNNDAHLLSGAISPLAEALTEHTQSVIAYPDIDNAGSITGTVYYQRHTGLLSSRPLPGSFPHASGCCQLIAVERSETTLFDEDFFMYGEDAELGARLGVARMTHVPKTLVYHEGSQSSGLGSDFYETRMIAAHWLLAHKLARSHTDLALLVCARFFTLGARAFLRALRFRSSMPIRALSRGWRIAHQRHNCDAP